MANLRKEWVYLSSEFKIIGGNKMHIAIAGNIGSGKTTLTNLLANH